MKTKFFVLFVMAALAGIVTGCVETVDGRAQPGVPFLKDKVEGRYERSLPQVIAAAKAVLKFNGQLTSDNSVNNSLEAKVNQESVWVKVDEIDPVKPVTRVQVQTRSRAGISDIDLAHEIEKQIALNLATHCSSSIAALNPGLPRRFRATVWWRVHLEGVIAQVAERGFATRSHMPIALNPEQWVKNSLWI